MNQKKIAKINTRFLKRNEIGFYNHVFRVAYKYFPGDLAGIIRMSKIQFDFFYALIGPNLIKTSIREPICPRERLVLTLR